MSKSVSGRDVEEFARRLKGARDDAQLSQAQLAQMLGLRQSSVAAWETAEAEPERETLFACEGMLRLTPGTLSEPLGYGPPPINCGVKGSAAKARNTREAILLDDRLSKAGKDVLLRTYRLLIAEKRCTSPFPAYEPFLDPDSGAHVAA